MRSNQPTPHSRSSRSPRGQERSSRTGAGTPRSTAGTPRSQARPTRLSAGTPRSQARPTRAGSYSTRTRAQVHPQRQTQTQAYAHVPAQTDTARIRIIGGVCILVVALIIIAICVATCTQPDTAQTESNTDAAVEDIEAAPTTVTLTFAGDCTLGTDEDFDYSTSFNAMYEEVDDPSWFFANVADIFGDSDLSIVNMEGTLTTATDRADKTYAFKGDAEYANVLVAGNVDAASMANNHSRDYGGESYTDTIETLEDAGITTFGYDRIAYMDVKGVRVALIGTYMLDEGLDIEDEMLENIHTAQEEGAQLIAVYVHWGIERTYAPETDQIELAHAAVDAGADVVIGSHPHVIQGYEKYHGRYIVYSLGNFCFGGNYDPDDKDCIIFQQTFTVDGTDVATDDNINVIPCSVSSVTDSNNYQPTPAQGSEAERIEEKIEESNAEIAAESQALDASEDTAESE